MISKRNIQIGCFLIVAIFGYLYFTKQTSWHTIEHVANTNNIVGMSAADACKTISSDADKIAATAKGASNVIQSVLGLFSPKNYGSGDNAASVETRSIIQNSFSTQEQTDIVNSCNNTAAVAQTNILDLTQCPYCQVNGCSVAHVKQTNDSQVTQNCLINAAISTLMAKQDDLTAQATAAAIQKAQGLLSGSNDTSDRSCSIVNNSMDASTYLKNLNTCSNAFSANQKNMINGCGSVLDVIQGNSSKTFQDCVLKNTTTTDTTSSTKASADSSAKSDQTTEGLTLAAILGIACSCCILCMASSALVLFSGGGSTGSGVTGDVTSGSAGSNKNLFNAENVTTLLDTISKFKK